MTAIPPSRYKVVERGRRLVVIDTQTGRPVSHEHAPPPPPPQSGPVNHPVELTAPRRIDDRSGSNILTTSRFYDLKGPRRIVMTESFSNRLSRAAGGWVAALMVFAVVAMFFPLLWLLPFVLLLQPKVRAAARNWITARLDEADQAAS